MKKILKKIGLKTLSKRNSIYAVDKLIVKLQQFLRIAKITTTRLKNALVANDNRDKIKWKLEDKLLLALAKILLVKTIWNF